MLDEVKKCADTNDIKGLRYIFIDSLDVDPTFEKYEQDYKFCKGLVGFFDEYIEITCLKQNPAEWSSSYWDQLKEDLRKNFSKIRFEHMMQVAKVVYSEKVERLRAEREAKKTKSETQIESGNPTSLNIDNIVSIQERTVMSGIPDTKMSSNVEKDIKESYKQFLESERKKENIAKKRAESEKRQKAEQENKQPKKWMGIALIAVVLIVVLKIAKVL